jgi:hypothetical protein
VIHPINDLPTNWYGERSGYNLKTDMGHDRFPFPALSGMENLLKPIYVNKVRDKAHCKEAIDLFIGKLDRQSRFVQFFTIIVAMS